MVDSDVIDDTDHRTELEKRPSPAVETDRPEPETRHPKRSRYDRMAAGLAAFGCIAALGAVYFTAERRLLFALSGASLVGGILAYSLASDRFVSASVAEHIYSAAAVNEAAIVDEIGVQDGYVYVPDEVNRVARLVIWEYADYERSADSVGPSSTEEATRKLVLEPMGAGLFGEFERSLAGDLESKPAPLAKQLTEGLVEQFELATTAESIVGREGNSVRVSLTGSAIGGVDRFDHPIASFLAVGFAVGLGRPIELDVESSEGRAEWVITCRW